MIINANNTRIENITPEFLSMIKLPEANGKRLNYLFVMPFGVRADSTYAFSTSIALVTAALKASGRSVFTFNPNFKEEPIEMLRRIITENNIDVIMTGGFSIEFWNIKTIIDAAKEIQSEITTVVGGSIITADPTTAMEALENADYGVIGEGEITLNALAYALENGFDPAELDGIVCRRDGIWSVRDKWPTIGNLDILPFPDYEGFEYGKMMGESNLSTSFAYVSNAIKNPKIGYINISRSCPFTCTFCFHPCGNNYRRMTIDHAFKLVDYMLSQHPIEVLMFQDEVTFSDHDYALEFCRRIKPYKLSWKCFIHAGLITDEMLMAMKESGCAVAFMGIESADKRILKSMRKGITIERVEEILEYAAKIDLLVFGGFIFGDLAETMETVYTSLNRVASRRDLYGGNKPTPLTMVSAYPGTHLYKVACERGLIKDRVQFLKDCFPLTNISKLTDDEYNALPALLNIFMQGDKLIDAKTAPQCDYTVNVAGRCPHCLSIAEYERLNLVSTLPQICPVCEKHVTVNPIDHCDFEKLNKNAEALIKGDKAAIWAITLNNFYWLLRLVPAFRTSNVRIVNKDEIICPSYFSQYGNQIRTVNGEEVFTPEVYIPNKIVLFLNKKEDFNHPAGKSIKTLEGKEIFKPEVIDRDCIKTIIVPNSPQVFQSIKDYCVTQLPHVKRIVHLTELL